MCKFKVMLIVFRRITNFSLIIFLVKVFAPRLLYIALIGTRGSRYVGLSEMFMIDFAMTNYFDRFASQ